MKYKGIICFVYQKEKDEIIQSIGDNHHIIFSENFDDLNKIKPEQYYIVTSFNIAGKNLDKFKQMLMSFPNNNYQILHENDFKFYHGVSDIFLKIKTAYHDFSTVQIIKKIRLTLSEYYEPEFNLELQFNDDSTIKLENVKSEEVFQRIKASSPDFPHHEGLINLYVEDMYLQELNETITRFVTDGKYKVEKWYRLLSTRIK